MNPVFIVVLCSGLGAVGQLFFKLGSSSLALSVEGLLLNWRLATGLFCYGLATLGFVYSLKELQLSVAYPIIALSYLWVGILAATFLKEQVFWYNVAGYFVIVCGVLLASWRS